MRKQRCFLVDWQMILNVLSKLEKERKISNLQYYCLDNDVDYVVRFTPCGNINYEFKEYFPGEESKHKGWITWKERGHASLRKDELFLKEVCHG